MKHILIAEDDADNNTMLKEYLESHGYICTQAFSGSEAKLLFSMKSFDLVLLDLMMPGITGEELVPLFSQTAPVIVLSAKSGLDSKVDVLSAGADDYLCKPFDLPELLVRIQVQLRRAPKTALREGDETRQVGQTAAPDGRIQDETSFRGHENEYSYRQWTLNPDTMEMTAAGKEISLTRHEFLILELLIRNPRRVFSKQMIYEYAWGEEYLAEDKTINVHISNIRTKLKDSKTDSYIQTVWGMGFKLC
ncbi:MAG: response regulator transcription factor [Lachnospiraceae bacterium]|jgi:DNA-binding response OmpR family regulator|nr:response regulator transcription factor [Lachnospiraceae bacterium]